MSLRTSLRKFLCQNKHSNWAAIVVRSRDYSKQYNHEENNYRKYGKTVAVALFGSVLIGSAVTDRASKKHPATEAVEAIDPPEPGAPRAGLPTFRAHEVSTHNTKASFWVTYKHGVYDVTSFLPSHPGGEQILNAGGLSVEPFWNVYGVHKTDQVYQLLESLRIGNLHPDDVCDHSDDEYWAREPRRDPRLIVKTARPFNAETPPQHLVRHFDTPSELFYVRQHMAVPELDAATHRVLVRVETEQTVTSHSYGLAELEKLPGATVRAALMCAGNRRSEMDRVRPVKGISWSTGAISNAVWGGVLLRDVLLHCGVDENDVEGKHVILRGADTDATGEQFNTSIPLSLALSRSGRVLLAVTMNGAPLGRDHGAPLRAVVPGAAAVRSVKWLESITVSSSESSSHWHKRDYRSFSPSVTWETADWDNAPPVYNVPVTSAICEPIGGETVAVKDGKISVKGYAYSGGGARIVRVDVRCGRGSWVQAALAASDGAPHRDHYGWTLWEASVPVPRGAKEVELCVKATDGNFNTQPEHFDDIWNIRGILSNAYHRITVKLDHK